MATSRARAAALAHHLPLMIVAAVLAAGSCSESPFAPRGEGERIPFGFSVEGSVAADSVRTYSFVADSGANYSVTVEALEGFVYLAVSDSLRGWNLAVASASADPGDPQSPGAVWTGWAGVQLIRVRAPSGVPSARFRFRLSALDPQPETRSADFAIGDTVTGETLEPFGDIDVFQTVGEPGQEIVAVFEAAGPAGAGGISVGASAPPSGPVFAGWEVLPGGPATWATGRIVLPASGRLAFRFQPELGRWPVFQGAYRFWTYAIDRAPEHRAASAALSSVIAGESIDRSGDVDEFRFTLGTGAEFNAFLQAPRAFSLEIASPSGEVVAAVTDTSPADTVLYHESTGRTQVLQGGTYVARVSGPNLMADTGAYRLFLYPIDRRPEHAGQVLVPNDTVAGESIDLPGDVDEFTFSAAAGERFGAFLQARDGSSRTRLTLEAFDADGTLLGTAYSAGSDTSLLQHLTGRFTMRTAGTHRLRVMGERWGEFAWSAGPYRLLLYHVNPLPETHAATLALGDSVLDESLDFPGDVDEFRVVVPDSSGANLFLEIPAALRGSGEIVAWLAASGAQDPFGLHVRRGSQGVAMSGGGRIGPGTYTLHVETEGFDGPPDLTGAYHLILRTFRFGPETARDTIAIGDTISSEAIEPLGDWDDFVFHGTRRQQIKIAFQGRGSASEGALQAFLSGTRGSGDPLMVVVSPASATALDDHQAPRRELPYTGWYRLRVSGAGTGAPMGEHGPYTLAVTPVSTAPEHVGAILHVGDSVTAEPLDFPSDLDQYRVQAPPGSEVYVVISSSERPDAGAFPRMRLIDPATGDQLVENVAQGQRILGPTRIPAGGELLLDVFGDYANEFRLCHDAVCGNYGVVGPYALRVVALQRAPESVPSAYVQGDTVRGESLDPVGDVDEFTATGTPGDTLSAWLRLTASPGPAGDYGGTFGPMITVEVVDPSTGAVLAGGTSATGPAPQIISPGGFAVPTSGTYLIRIRGTGGYGEDIGTGPYEFFVKRGR